VPCSLINESRDSTHSAVSSGSRSGSWLVNPLRIWEVSSPAATSNLSLRALRRTQAGQGDRPAYIRRVRRIGYNSPVMCAGQGPSIPTSAMELQGCCPAGIVVTCHSNSHLSAMRSRGLGGSVVFRRHTGCVTKSRCDACCPSRCDAEYAELRGLQLEAQAQRVLAWE
jgi:hypothetical protein